MTSAVKMLEFELIGMPGNFLGNFPMLILKCHVYIHSFVTSCVTASSEHLYMGLNIVL